MNPGNPFIIPYLKARVDSCLLARKQGLHSYNQLNLATSQFDFQEALVL